MLMYILLMAMVTGVDLKPETVLAHLQRVRSFDNVVLDVSWESLSNGKHSGWEEQEIRTDNLGRFYMSTKSGVYDEDGRKVSDPGVTTTDRVYDGEKTATVRFYANRDRFGTPKVLAADQSGYRAAQIHDGKFPPSGIADYRNPLSEVSIEIIGGLVESSRAHRVVRLAPYKQDKGIYRLECSRDKDRSIPGSVRLVALLEEAKGWFPSQIDAIGDDGQIVRRLTCEYARTANGFWIPTKGSIKHYGGRRQDEVPIWETRFEVSRAEVNNPNFDESVFKISLPPDTAVSDIRFNVNYRVGAEQVLGSQLTALAQKALKEKESSILGEPEETSSARWVFISVNVVLVLALAGLLVRRRLAPVRT